MNRSAFQHRGQFHNGRGSDSLPGMEGFAVEYLPEQFTMAAMDRDVQSFLAFIFIASHRREQGKRRICRHRGIPSIAQSARRRDADTYARETARPAIDDNAIGAPAFGQVRDDGDQLFGVPATSDLVMRCCQCIVGEQRHRQCFCCRIDYKLPHYFRPQISPSTAISRFVTICKFVLWPA